MREPHRIIPTSTLTLMLVSLVALGGCPSDSPIADKRAPRPRAKVTAPAPVEVRVDDPNTVQYTLRFPGRHNHYVDIEAVFPASGDSLVLSMATWTPGSYLVRDFNRFVEAMTAATPDGQARALEKVSRNRWQIATGGSDRIAVRYRVYGRQLTVRTNYITDEIAILNGAAMFFTVADDKVRPFDLTIEMPPDWPHSVTALDAHPSGGAHRYLAPDYDTLLDSPIVLGQPALHEFEIEGVPHVLANFGEAGVWDGPRSATDTEAIARTHIAMWGEIPYRRYIFQNILWEAGGGLEHKASTLMLSSRFATRKPKKYKRWLELVSHEFFHTWNVKRLRPKALGPFDYESERYTRSLWIAEGITSYYDALTLRRAGLIDESDYLARLTEEIESLQGRPGRAVQSLSDSSFDTWIKFYRPHENSRNTTVSYYNKGALVSWLLDAEIRIATQNRKSLDDVLRAAYDRYSGDVGYTPEEFRAVAAEVTGRSLDDFFARYVDGTEELDYGPALAFYGLRFKPEPEKSEKSEKDDPPAGYLGVKRSGGDITEVERDAPAYFAGLEVGDEILAINKFRVPAGDLGDHLKLYRPGATVSVLIARRGKLRRIEVSLGEKPRTDWKVELDPTATQLAKSRRASWLAEVAEAKAR